MNEVFNSNNPAMRFMSNIFNIFWVNLIFLLTCIPLITIGPALCALYHVCIKIVSGEDVHVYHEYFGEFKKSFVKGLILWLGILATGTFFGIELYAIYFRPDLVPESLSFLQYPVWIVVFLILQVFLYGFALIATFENSLKNTVKNAILLSIKNIMITIMLIAIWLFTPLMMNTFQGFIYGFLGFELFFGMAFRVLCCSLFLHRAFGLKKLKVARDGTPHEVSYDDMIIKEENESETETSGSEKDTASENTEEEKTPSTSDSASEDQDPSEEDPEK